MANPTIDQIVAADEAAQPTLPAIPDIDITDTERASTAYSQHRTKLSTHRTALSTNRTEMSSRRTGMSFQRTRMSAERTLMSVIRTALSLIGFGFTIFQVFEKLQEKNLITGAHAPGNFGATLVYLGVGMVAVGIFYHLQFMWHLRRDRRAMKAEGLIHAASGFPISLTLLVALAVLFLGIAAIAGVGFNAGPFG